MATSEQEYLRREAGHGFQLRMRRHLEAQQQIKFVIDFEGNDHFNGKPDYLAQLITGEWFLAEMKLDGKGDGNFFLPEAQCLSYERWRTELGLRTVVIFAGPIEPSRPTGALHVSKIDPLGPYVGPLLEANTGVVGRPIHYLQYTIQQVLEGMM